MSNLYYNNRTVWLYVCVTSAKRDTQATIALFSRASCTLRDATQVVTFLSVTKKMSGRTEKVTLFNAFLPAGLIDLD